MSKIITTKKKTSHEDEEVLTKLRRKITHLDKKKYIKFKNLNERNSSEEFFLRLIIISNEISNKKFFFKIQIKEQPTIQST